MELNHPKLMPRYRRLHNHRTLNLGASTPCVEASGAEMVCGAEAWKGTAEVGKEWQTRMLEHRQSYARSQNMFSSTETRVSH
jgi:hypothetical protein